MFFRGDSFYYYSQKFDWLFVSCFFLNSICDLVVLVFKLIKKDFDAKLIIFSKQPIMDTLNSNPNRIQKFCNKLSAIFKEKSAKFSGNNNNS